MSNKRWVVKIGSALLTHEGKGLNLEYIANIVEQVFHLHRRGFSVTIVSSGAIAEGMVRLGWSTRPRALRNLQAAAAVGQARLVQAYESQFRKVGLCTAQILLCHDDILAQDRYFNANVTLNTLLQLGVVPVVNENDAVATDEIRFGDNDTLAGYVSNLVDAERLVILTDRDGLFERDPGRFPGAKLIPYSLANNHKIDSMVCRSSGVGHGGMVAKINAARIAARLRADTLIANGRTSSILIRSADGEAVGTFLAADPANLELYLSSQSDLSFAVGA